MKNSILKRLQALENDEIIEIEDISDYEREIFGDEGDVADEHHKVIAAKAERA